MDDDRPCFIFIFNYKKLQLLNMNVLVQHLSDIWSFEVCENHMGKTPKKNYLK